MDTSSLVKIGWDGEAQILPCFTIRQVANAWDCSTRTIQRMIKAGELASFRIGRNGRSVRILAEDLKKWAQQRTQCMVGKIQSVKVLLEKPTMVSVQTAPQAAQEGQPA